MGAKTKTAAPGSKGGGNKQVESSTVNAILARKERKVHPLNALADAFQERFAGLDRAYGRFSTGVRRGVKVEGKAFLVKEPVTRWQWVEHLIGRTGLGIVPIRDDATCVWGAVDVDDYSLDLEDLNRQIQARDLPLILCRSKSGGAHLYVFTKEPAPARLVRTKLMEMAVLLGRAKAEVFPKQVRLASEKDFGSWLNMPYFGRGRTNRYALDPATGKRITSPDAFLKLADRLAVTVADLEAMDLGRHEQYSTGPPCLQVLAGQGFPEGSRNNGLYNVAVYLRKRHGEDGWDRELNAINHELMEPPLDHQEVAAVIKSVGKKAYEFKCSEAPICNACNRELCLTREFGIRGASGDPGVTFGELLVINTDPPLYVWDVNGERLELTSNQIMKQPLFHRACVERLRVWPHMIKSADWQDLVRERLATSKTQDAPEEASLDGRILALLEEFFITRPHGLTREDLLLGKPWTDEGWTHFRAGDFLQYLDQQRVKGVDERKVWATLRRAGARYGDWNLKGKHHVRWWAMPEVATPSGPLPTPRIGGASP